MKTLNLYRASFIGRECGAIGITYNIRCNVIGSDEKQPDKFRDQFLTKYYVYKHDTKTEIDHVSNYAISDDPQSFRSVPCEALIGTEEVYATSKDNALSIAKFNLKQRGLT